MKIFVSTSLIIFLTTISIVISNAQTTKYQQPVLISSAGQSADVTLAGILF